MINDAKVVKKKNFIGLPTTFSYLCVSIQADMKKESQVIFDKNVIEFVTVAAEFCAFLERAEGMKRSMFVDTTLKILPLLYLKASMLPKCEMIGDEAPETYVTEEIYEVLRINLASVLAEKDDYLEVFLPDMAYSDEPIKKNISEDLADIYQDIKDFIFVFQLGLNETMNDSLAICQENFGLLWGQKLVNTMRALHDVKYSPRPGEKTKRRMNTNPKTMKTVTVKMTTAIVTIMAVIATTMNKRI